jgi:hypothetical protein
MQQLSISQDTLDQLDRQQKDIGLVSYIFHKLFDNPNANADLIDAPSDWRRDPVWLAKYHLYFEKHKHILQGANVLDIGSNLAFEMVEAIELGAKSAFGIEPCKERQALSKEYVERKGFAQKVQSNTWSIDQLFENYTDINVNFDVVTFIDTIYYISDPVTVLYKIQKVINPKYVFFSTRYIPDYGPRGHFELRTVGTDPLQFEGYAEYPGQVEKWRVFPSKNAIENIIKSMKNCKVLAKYDWKDFDLMDNIKQSNKEKIFYLLEFK